MPELPEVESVRRGLAHAAVGRRLRAVERSRLPLRTGAHWRREQLELLRPGQELVAVTRRAKFLRLQFAARGERAPAVELLLHLGMSGRVQLGPRSAARSDHTHLVLGWADGDELRFVDPRRFGGLIAAPAGTLDHRLPLAELGPEPLDPPIDGATLAARAHGSRRGIRDVLLDQRVVAGVGNIYACEALHLAGVHPMAPAAGLRSPQWDALARALVGVLEAAIARGGTTLRDHRGLDGSWGTAQELLRVYGRAGAPCLGCGTAVEVARPAGRGLWWCPSCQPRRAPRRPRGRSVSA